jgi:hypothetical protein
MKRDRMKMKRDEKSTNKLREMNKLKEMNKLREMRRAPTSLER